MSSPRRRYVIYYLREEGGPVELTTLAEHVAAWENDTTVEELDSQDRKRVYVSLYQTHIPRLAEAGVVEYDQDTGDVALASRADQIDSYIRNGEEETPWYRYYLALAVVSALVFLGQLADLPVLGAIDTTLLTVAVILAFSALTVIQFLDRYRRNNTVPEKLEQKE
ncbi:MAG: hypothetical protein ABEJ89_08775 [Haloarculaceae archaeon]